METDHTAAIYQQRREQMDVNLNIVDVTNSYDSGASPLYNDGSPSSSFERGYKKNLNSFEDDNSFPDNDVEPSNESSEKIPSEPYSDVGFLEEGHQPPNESLVLPPPRISQRKNYPKLEPFRYFPMLILANLFFLIGSAAFCWLSWKEEYMGGKHQVAGKNEIKFDTSGEGDEYPKEDEKYAHLKLSTSLDTYITQEMILALVAMFFMLQTGIVNFVRTWQFFNICQILAGLCGLVSAMFWETKILLSDVFYFLFCHAMLLQASLSLHMSYQSYIQPHLDEFKHENQERPAQTKQNQSHLLSPRQKRDVESPFIYESARDLSQNPSGLLTPSDDENEVKNNADTYEELRWQHDSNEHCFSIENSYSYDEDGPPATIPAPAPAVNTTPTQGPDEYLSTREGKRLLSSRRKEDDAMSKKFKYGIAFCVADSLFVLGSILEAALTYLVVFVLAGDSSASTTNSQEDTDESQSIWKAISEALRIVPGILWGLCAAITLITAFSFQICATKAQRK